MVSKIDEFIERTSILSSMSAKHSSATTQARISPPTEKDDTGSFPYIREALIQQGFSDESCQIILSGWRKSSRTQYASYIKRWLIFCDRKGFKTDRPGVHIVVMFLTKLFSLGLSYSALVSARAAVNAYTSICGNIDYSDNKILKKFMHGIFNKRPNIPKHPVLWDVNIVFSYICQVTDDSLMFLSGKLCLLFLLLSAQEAKLYI